MLIRNDKIELLTGGASSLLPKTASVIVENF
jgi:hypothetical protein